MGKSEVNLEFAFSNLVEQCSRSSGGSSQAEPTLPLPPMRPKHAEALQMTRRPAYRPNDGGIDIDIPQ